jgi:hypothetical protein
VAYRYRGLTARQLAENNAATILQLSWSAKRFLKAGAGSMTLIDNPSTFMYFSLN